MQTTAPPYSLPQADVLAFGSLFALTFSSLGLEVCLTRLFSFLFLHAYVYLIISLAMAGLGIGAALLSFLTHYAKQSYFNHLPFLPLLTLALLLGLNMAGAHVTACLLPTLLLFVTIGSASTILFQRTGLSLSVLYFVDLIGASVGVLSSFYLLNALGAIKAVIILMSLASFSMVILHHTLFRPSGRLTVVKTMLVAALLPLLLFDLDPLVTPYRNRFKDMSTLLSENENAVITDTRWTAFGRSDLVATDNPLLKTLYIDGAAGTKMLQMTGGKLEPELHEALKYKYVTGIALLPIPADQRRQALVVGSGGGIDVVTLLVADYQQIDAVEINPDFIDLVKKYGPYNGDVYNGHPRVTVINREGRSYIRSCPKQYDLILMSLPIIKSARNVGSHALTENHLFTYEAFNDYWHALGPNGILVVVAHYPAEAYRLVVNAVKAFQSRGSTTEKALAHMVLIGRNQAPAFILQKRPLTVEDAETYYGMIRTLGQEGETNFIPHVDQQRIEYYDTETGQLTSKPMINQGLYELARGRMVLEGFVDKHPEKIDWISDDSPFFYQMEKRIPTEIIVVLGTALLLFVGFSAAFSNRHARTAHSGRGLFAGFAGIGLAFMLIEIAVIQKFILFWGHQTLALAILLSFILTSVGIGSYVCGRLPGLLGKLKVSLLATELLTVIFYLLNGPVLTEFESASTMVKILVSSAMIFPLFFTMGFPFPTLLTMVKKRGGPALFPWMLGINSLAALLGGALAIAIAIQLGYRFVLFSGVLVYGLLWIGIMFGHRIIQPAAASCFDQADSLST